MTLEKNNPDMQAEDILSDNQLDGQEFKKLVESSLFWLKTNQQTVNALNVFPVPDGDTGTNMVLTMQSAYNEIANSGEKNVGKMVHAIAKGALMGARGNSGVILSQIWRGFARAMDNLEKMTSVDFSRALTEGKVTAYKGVVRPVEGTILTVIKDVATTVETKLSSTDKFYDILNEVVREADASVRRTPDLLPILKQAGVVDSGGKGLFYIFEGMQRYLRGLPLDVPLTTVQPLSTMKLEDTLESIEPGQDFEVVIDFCPRQPLDLDFYYTKLAEIGTSIQVGEGDGMYRMHIHVAEEKRYQPIDYTMTLGTVSKVSIENLHAQMEEIENRLGKLTMTPVRPGQVAVIAVSPGLGISRIFASLGIAGVIEGGQTMNPSTQEILTKIENVQTDKIIILPNNKNIVLAAQAAAGITAKQVQVVASHTVPQGLSAMLRHNPDADIKELVEEMTEALGDVETGEVTIATRTVEINGVNVEEGQVIALLNGKLVCSTATLEQACLELLEKGSTLERERITLFYGAGLKIDDINLIVDKIRSVYPNHEIEIHEGGQPHYQFIIAIE